MRRSAAPARAELCAAMGADWVLTGASDMGGFFQIAFNFRRSFADEFDGLVRFLRLSRFNLNSALSRRASD